MLNESDWEVWSRKMWECVIGCDAGFGLGWGGQT